jgi:hypothetical protein
MASATMSSNTVTREAQAVETRPEEHHRGQWRDKKKDRNPRSKKKMDGDGSHMPAYNHPKVKHSESSCGQGEKGRVQTNVLGPGSPCIIQ